MAWTDGHHTLAIETILMTAESVIATQGGLRVNFMLCRNDAVSD